MILAYWQASTCWFWWFGNVGCCRLASLQLCPLFHVKVMVPVKLHLLNVHVWKISFCWRGTYQMMITKFIISCYRAVMIMTTHFNTILLIVRSLSIGSTLIISDAIASPLRFLAGYACIVVLRIRKVLKIILPIIQMFCFHGVCIAKWPKFANYLRTTSWKIMYCIV